MLSETMVQDERNTIQYSVSSSMYYGYVPLTVRDNQQESWNPWRSCRLEAADWNRRLHNSQQLPREDIGDTRKCLKRRRDFTSQELPLGLKRFRGENSMAMPTILTVQEVQNSMDWTCNNTAEALDVDLDAAVCTGIEEAASESCLQTWAAGNSSSISKPDHKHLSPSNDSKSDDSSDEYEKLLFTTHGCAAHHHQRVVLNHMEI